MRTRSITFKQAAIIDKNGYDEHGARRGRSQELYNALDPPSCRACREEISGPNKSSIQFRECTVPNGDRAEAMADREGATADHGSEAPTTWMAMPQAFSKAGYETIGAGITLGEFSKNFLECLSCWNAGYFLAHASNNQPRKINGDIDLEFGAAVGDWLRQRANSKTMRHEAPFFAMVGFWGGHVPYPEHEAPTTLQDAIGSMRMHGPDGGADPVYIRGPDRRAKRNEASRARHALTKRLQVWDRALGGLMSTL
jgi:hypothetical protein